MTIFADPAQPITTGDTAFAVVYHIMDAEGSLWRSSPALVADGVKGDGINVGSLNASGEWLRIPTARHLLEGTRAEIEIYIQRDGTDLQLFRTIENDPTVDYVDFCIGAPLEWNGTDQITMLSVDAATAAAGPGEILYTTGGALANDPPPQCACLTIWRNRILACFGDTIYPSQEFADGWGVQFSNTLKSQWKEGTGDITGICPIDWNYCAVFKKDAIGVISGPGPDGMGHGNYIIQTLQTKMGCTNPKSIVNGADGCYFQDYATGRIAVLTPQLNPQECLLGWFNEEQATVTAALQVEAKRAVWFATNSQDIIVLDYKHRTERCPNGQVFVWDISGLGLSAAGLAVVGGIPRMICTDGSMAEYHESLPMDMVSDSASATILMSLETGELQPSNLQAMFDVSRVLFLGEYLAAHSVKITPMPQFATSGTALTVAMSAAPEQFSMRPAGCQRIQSVRFKIEELAATSGTPPATVYGKGFEFVGLGLEIQARGKLQFQNSGRIY